MVKIEANELKMSKRSFSATIYRENMKVLAKLKVCRHFGCSRTIVVVSESHFTSEETVELA